MTEQELADIEEIAAQKAPLKRHKVQALIAEVRRLTAKQEAHRCDRYELFGLPGVSFCRKGGAKVVGEKLHDAHEALAEADRIAASNAHKLAVAEKALAESRAAHVAQGQALQKVIDDCKEARSEIQRMSGSRPGDVIDADRAYRRRLDEITFERDALRKALDDANRVCDKIGCLAAVVKRESTGRRECAAGHASRWCEKTDLDAAKKALAESQAREQALRRVLARAESPHWENCDTNTPVPLDGSLGAGCNCGADDEFDAPVDDTALKAALAAAHESTRRDCDMYVVDALGPLNAGPYAAMVRDGLREFGLKVARLAVKAHQRFDRSNEEVVEAVLRGESPARMTGFGQGCHDWRIESDGHSQCAACKMNWIDYHDSINWLTGEGKKCASAPAPDIGKGEAAQPMRRPTVAELTALLAPAEDPHQPEFYRTGQTGVEPMPKPVRDLGEVMKRIRPLLVQGGVDAAGFDSIATGVGFTAPEEMLMRWQQLCDWLGENLPPPVVGAPAWVHEVSAIITGRT